MKLFRNIIVCVIVFCLAFQACQKDDNNSDGLLRNDLLRKTIGPAMVGETLELVYALGSVDGFVQSASVEASVPGADGTSFDSVSWYTDRNTGLDVSVRTTRSVHTNSAISTAEIIDTNAVALRYFYIVPENARGGEVSFNFSGTSSTGQTTSMSSPAIPISAMDMERSIVLEDGGTCYFSIEDMAAYTREEVETQNLADKIDFVYIYRATMGSGNYAFGHALVALSNEDYINDLNIPSSWTSRTTLMDRRVDVGDAQLKGSSPAVFIDDRDLQQVDFTNAADYAFGFAADQGAFMRTADGQYTAYVYINSVDNGSGTATVGIKRLRN